MENDFPHQRDSGEIVVQFLKQVAHYAPATIVPALTAILGSFVFTRIYSTTEYGLLSLILAVTGPVRTGMAEWLGQPLGRFYAEYRHEGSLDLYLATVRTVVIIISTVVVAIGSLFFVAQYTTDIAKIPPLLLIGAMLSTLVNVVFLTVLRILPAKFAISTYRRIQILSSLFGFTTTVALILLMGIDVGWLIWGPLLALLPFAVYLLRSEVFVGVPLVWNDDIKSTLRRFLSYGAPMAIWFFAMQLLSVGDRYLIQVFYGGEALGVYSVNYNIAAQAVSFLNRPILAAAGPILMHQWAKRQLVSAQSTISRMTEIYVILASGVVGLTYVVSYPLVSILFGPDFRYGYSIITPVVAGALIMGLALFGQKSIEFAERTMVMVRAALVAVGVNAISNLLLIPQYGFIAAAYTTLVSYVVYTMLIWWETRQLLYWDVKLRTLTFSIIASVLASIVASMIPKLNSPMYQLLIGSLGYGSAYLVLIGLFLRKEFKGILVWIGISRYLRTPMHALPGRPVNLEEESI